MTEIIPYCLLCGEELKEIDSYFCCSCPNSNLIDKHKHSNFCPVCLSPLFIDNDYAFCSNQRCPTYIDIINNFNVKGIITYYKNYRIFVHTIKSKRQFIVCSHDALYPVTITASSNPKLHKILDYIEEQTPYTKHF